MSGPRTLFRGIGFFGFLVFFVFFGFPRVFFDFWLRKLLSATRATKNLEENQKNTVFSGMSGPLSSDAVVFYVFFFFLFCGFLVFVFWLW